MVIDDTTRFRADDHALTDRLLARLEAGPGEPGDWRELADGGVLMFKSRTEEGAQVALVCDPALVRQVLADPQRFSNEPYAAIGGGGFMLAMDGTPHAEQRGWVQQQLFGGRSGQPLWIGQLAEIACAEALTLPLKRARFDLVDLARQAALRFAGKLFGLPRSDHVLLMRSMQYLYDGLVHQIIGRHVNTDPQQAWRRSSSTALRDRIKELIADHQSLAGTGADADAAVPVDVRTARRRQTLHKELDTLRADIARLTGGAGPVAFTPLCARFGTRPQGQAGEPQSPDERAALVIGLIGGVIGNVQTSVAIVVDRLLAGTGTELRQAVRLAQAVCAPAGDTPGAKAARDELRGCIRTILAAQPPVAFVPRRVAGLGAPVELGGQRLVRGTDLILAMGAPARSAAAASGSAATELGGAEAAIFGTGRPHDCIGQYLIEPLLVRITAEVLRLPGLDFVWNDTDRRLQRLQRRWAFKALPLPLQYARDSRLVQQPLCVLMDVKEPVAEHAAALQAVIGYGAPVIERSLREARHVHFAWFLLLDDNRKLALFTTYDGDFDAYIEYFANAVGDLFDTLFEHLADPPPMPVHQHPKEFVAKIRAYNGRNAPVGGYLFSAHPTLRVADLDNAAAPWRARARPLPDGATS